MQKTLILFQGAGGIAFLQFFTADHLPIFEFGIKLAVGAFTCYALYKQSKKKN